jgi:hypothetical protein
MRRLFLVIPALLVGIFLSATAVDAGGPANQKYNITADPTPIYLKPDISSSVIATLDIGSEVTLASSARFRKYFFYVYFRSSGGNVISGYVLENNIAKVARPINSRPLQEGTLSNHKTKNDQAEAVVWGMELDSFEKTNGSPDELEVLDDLTILHYRMKVMNLDCRVGYVFLKQRLARTQYDFQDKQKQSLPFIDEYDRMKQILVQRYGDPLLDKSIWTDSTFQANRKDWEEAVRQGHLAYRARWMVSDTAISLVLFGEQNHTSLCMEYASPNNSSITGKAEVSRDLDY